MPAPGRTRVYRGHALRTIGMPCGGIAAGQLYVLGDGTLGCWQIDGANYCAGVGHTSYRSDPPPRPIQQGFALAARDERGLVSSALLSQAGYNAIEFVGEYPRARIAYRHDPTAVAADPVPPVDVALEVFSPFVPLNARESAWPATVLRFTLCNRAAGPLDVALGGWLENMVFGERFHPVTLRRVNQVIDDDGVTSVVLSAVRAAQPAPPNAPITRILADFGRGNRAGWTVSGRAFDDTLPADAPPPVPTANDDVAAHRVHRYHDPRVERVSGLMVSSPFTIDLPHLVFRIGGGDHESKTRLNLVVDGRVVRTATGHGNARLEPRAWDVRDLHGRAARLEIIDYQTAGWNHINCDQIALTSAWPEEAAEYSTRALSHGSLALSLVGDGDAAPEWPGPDAFIAALHDATDQPHHSAESRFDDAPVGSVVARRRLAPGAQIDVTFIVSWHFPNVHSRNGRMYENWFDDARDVAVQLVDRLDELTERTRRFCDTYYRETTLPAWLAARLMMPVANLATNTAQWWRSGRFWAWEGVCCCTGTCTHVWNYAQAHAWLFPELARSVRTMQDLDNALDATRGLVGFRSDRNFAADGQAGTVLKCYREHCTSADDGFLREHWSRIRLVLEYLIEHDGDDDGIIANDAQHNTYDINFVGPNTFVGALYLAALRAGARMATHMGDAAFAARCDRLFERGREWTAANLFNGEYFEQRLPAGDTRPWQYGTGCLSDQLFGQNWAHLLGLGYVYPRDQVRTALKAVFQHNWTPDVGPHNATYPPERTYAEPGEPGLFICTWPRGGRPDEPVRYRDEVWTGIEYQVAAGLIWEGFVDEGLRIVRSIDERYDGARHNPWNEVECGDHYARALASWSVLHALAGFTFDGPAGRLSLAPRITPEDFACFFAAGTAWGTLSQQRSERQQVVGIAVVEGRARLRVIETRLPTDSPAQRVATRIVEAGGQRTEVAAQWTQAGTQAAVRMDETFVQAGQRLVVELNW